MMSFLSNMSKAIAHEYNNDIPTFIVLSTNLETELDRSADEEAFIKNDYNAVDNLYAITE